MKAHASFSASACQALVYASSNFAYLLLLCLPVTAPREGSKHSRSRRFGFQRASASVQPLDPGIWQSHAGRSDAISHRRYQRRHQDDFSRLR